MKEMLILEGKMGMSYGREFRPVRIENTIFDAITKGMVLDEIGETGNKRLSMESTVQGKQLYQG